MTGAIIIFPITYILSDVFSEVYGYRWSRITCYM
ncbi:VUT family protein [bacterium]|nr:VUT family protein [bacterium]